MKKIIAMLLLIFSFTYSTTIYASAAEKWEYDVIPDQKQKLKVTGHKVDQFGDAVNDKKYTTTIDPKTVANKQKMGGVAIAKLLRKANWASVGVEAFDQLLKGLDWVMDVEKQSIWRNKNTGADACKYCSYDVEVTVNNSPNNPFYSIDSAEKEVERVSGRSKTDHVYDWQEKKDNSGKVIGLDLTLRVNGGSLGKYAYAKIIREPDPEIEYLTPEAAADYANHTHPDYTNPKYKDKANPLYKPEIQEKLWKPHNEWEKENSPTVQEAIKQLEVANPDSKDDTIKENEPNPETGEKSFSLPAFCNWATAVCDFFDWMKQEPEKDPEQDLPVVDDKGIFSKTFDHVFSLSSQCPPDIPWKLESTYLSGNFTFSMKWLCIIFTALGYPIVFASHCIGVWILYEATVRKEMKW